MRDHVHHFRFSVLPPMAGAAVHKFGNAEMARILRQKLFGSIIARSLCFPNLKDVFHG